MRTHESVLLQNYEIEQVVETGEAWHVRKYLHHGEEIMENRLVVAFSPSGVVTVQAQCNALGSFHELSSITLSREQFDFLRGLEKLAKRPGGGITERHDDES